MGTIIGQHFTNEKLDLQKVNNLAKVSENGMKAI
jgi:hypothetical protein